MTFFIKGNDDVALDDVSGRYICLANNREGHAHKEVFVRALTAAEVVSRGEHKDSVDKVARLP